MLRLLRHTLKRVARIQYIDRESASSVMYVKMNATWQMKYNADSCIYAGTINEDVLIILLINNYIMTILLCMACVSITDNTVQTYSIILIYYMHIYK